MLWRNFMQSPADGGWALPLFVFPARIVVVSLGTPGTALARVIPQRDAGAPAARLHAERFGVTSLEAQGMREPVAILFAIVRRADLARVLDRVRSYNPRAFVAVEDVRGAREGFLRRPGA